MTGTVFTHEAVERVTEADGSLRYRCTDCGFSDTAVQKFEQYRCAAPPEASV